MVMCLFILEYLIIVVYILFGIYVFWWKLSMGYGNLLGFVNVVNDDVI